MRKLGILTAALLLGTMVNAQDNWGFDAAHSNIRFAVSHMVISEVEGNFGSYEGSVKASKSDFSDAVINFSIDVSSIDTDNENRDEHLRNADFFNVEQFPTITFKSKSMEKMDEKNFKLTGDFTMLGVTREIVLKATYGGTVTDPWGNVKAGFKVRGTIDRTQWGLVYNSTLESGGLMLGEEVEIVANVELIKL